MTMTRQPLLPLFTVGLLCLAATCTAAEPASESAEQATPTTRGIIDLEQDTRPDTAVQLVGDEGHAFIPEPATGREVESKWVYADGVLTASPSWDSVITPDNYTDFRLYLEFNVNISDNPNPNPEQDGNSGVYIQQRYEIQIQNAFGIAEEDFKHTYCGSIYKFKKPDHLVAKPAGEWQTYDIVFRAARFDGDTKTENARITVYHNGTLIHDDVELSNKTGAGRAEGPEPGPIKLQGHNNPVQYRNVWVQRLEL